MIHIDLGIFCIVKVICLGLPFVSVLKVLCRVWYPFYIVASFCKLQITMAQYTQLALNGNPNAFDTNSNGDLIVATPSCLAFFQSNFNDFSINNTPVRIIHYEQPQPIVQLRCHKYFGVSSLATLRAGVVSIWDGTHSFRPLVSSIQSNVNTSITDMQWVSGDASSPKVIGTCTSDGVVSIWDIRSPSAGIAVAGSKNYPTKSVCVNNNNGYCHQLEFHPSDTNIFSVHSNYGVSVHDLRRNTDSSSNSDSSSVLFRFDFPGSSSACERICCSAWGNQQHPCVYISSINPNPGGAGAATVEVQGWNISSKPTLEYVATMPSPPTDTRVHCLAAAPCSVGVIAYTSSTSFVASAASSESRTDVVSVPVFGSVEAEPPKERSIESVVTQFMPTDTEALTQVAARKHNLYSMSQVVVPAASETPEAVLAAQEVQFLGLRVMGNRRTIPKYSSRANSMYNVKMLTHSGMLVSTKLVDNSTNARITVYSGGGGGIVGGSIPAATEPTYSVEALAENVMNNSGLARDAGMPRERDARGRTMTFEQFWSVLEEEALFIQSLGEELEEKQHVAKPVAKPKAPQPQWALPQAHGISIESLDVVGRQLAMSLTVLRLRRDDEDDDAPGTAARAGRGRGKHGFKKRTPFSVFSEGSLQLQSHSNLKYCSTVVVSFPSTFPVTGVPSFAVKVVYSPTAGGGDNSRNPMRETVSDVHKQYSEQLVLDLTRRANDVLGRDGGLTSYSAIARTLHSLMLELCQCLLEVTKRNCREETLTAASASPGPGVGVVVGGGVGHSRSDSKGDNGLDGQVAGSALADSAEVKSEGTLDSDSEDDSSDGTSCTSDDDNSDSDESTERGPVQKKAYDPKKNMENMSNPRNDNYMLCSPRTSGAVFSPGGGKLLCFGGAKLVTGLTRIATSSKSPGSIVDPPLRRGGVSSGSLDSVAGKDETALKLTEAATAAATTTTKPAGDSDDAEDSAESSLVAYPKCYADFLVLQKRDLEQQALRAEVDRAALAAAALAFSEAQARQQESTDAAEAETAESGETGEGALSDGDLEKEGSAANTAGAEGDSSSASSSSVSTGTLVVDTRTGTVGASTTLNMSSNPEGMASSGLSFSLSPASAPSTSASGLFTTVPDSRPGAAGFNGVAGSVPLPPPPTGTQGAGESKGQLVWPLLAEHDVITKTPFQLNSYIATADEATRMDLARRYILRPISRGRCADLARADMQTGGIAARELRLLRFADLEDYLYPESNAQQPASTGHVQAKKQSPAGAEPVVVTATNTLDQPTCSIESKWSKAEADHFAKQAQQLALLSYAMHGASAQSENAVAVVPAITTDTAGAELDIVSPAIIVSSPITVEGADRPEQPSDSTEDDSTELSVAVPKAVSRSSFYMLDAKQGSFNELSLFNISDAAPFLGPGAVPVLASASRIAIPGVPPSAPAMLNLRDWYNLQNVTPDLETNATISGATSQSPPFYISQGEVWSPSFGSDVMHMQFGSSGGGIADAPASRRGSPPRRYAPPNAAPSAHVADLQRHALDMLYGGVADGPAGPLTTIAPSGSEPSPSSTVSPVTPLGSVHPASLLPETLSRTIPTDDVNVSVAAKAASCRYNALMAQIQKAPTTVELWHVAAMAFDCCIPELGSTRADDEYPQWWLSAALGGRLIGSVLMFCCSTGDLQTYSSLLCIFSCGIRDHADVVASLVQIVAPTGPRERELSLTKMDGALCAYTDVLHRWGCPVRASLVQNYITTEYHKYYSDQPLQLGAGGGCGTSGPYRLRSQSGDKVGVQDTKESSGTPWGSRSRSMSETHRRAGKEVAAVLPFPEVVDITAPSASKEALSFCPHASPMAVAYNCGNCGQELPEEMNVCPGCMHFQTSNKQAIRCAICHESCSKMASFCFACGHGGHVDHMYCWFLERDECPTGCGCICGDVFREQEALSEGVDGDFFGDGESCDSNGNAGDYFFEDELGAGPVPGPPSSASAGLGKARERGFSSASDADFAFEGGDSPSSGHFNDKNRQWSAGFRGLADFLSTGADVPPSRGVSAGDSGAGGGGSGSGASSFTHDSVLENAPHSGTMSGASNNSGTMKRLHSKSKPRTSHDGVANNTSSFATPSYYYY